MTMTRTKVFAFAVFFVALGAAEAVFELTPENFDSFVGAGSPKSALVKFFTPWCGHCKNLAPEYEKAAEAFSGSTQVVIGEVNCDAHKDLCSRFGIRGFPTVKFFPAGVDSKTSGVDYQKERTAEALIAFVESKGSRRTVAVPRSPVVSLLDSTFDSIVLDPSKNVLVKFFAPFCGHCKKLAPDYEKVAHIYAGDSADVVIAEVNCDEAKKTCTSQDIQGYPTMKWFPKEGKDEPEEYRRGRAVADFVGFVNEKAGLQRTESGRLSETAGRVEALDAIAEKFVSADASEAAKLLEEAKTVAESLGANHRSAKFYVKAMAMIMKKGAGFVEKEKTRIAGIIDGGSVSVAKIDDFTIRKNILAVF